MPLERGVLTARQFVKRAKRRQRRLEKPAYVNTDASWRDGMAGLAYESGTLGNRTALVACANSTEAEYLALLMAMLDAERCLSGPIAFRCDCTAVVNLKGGQAPKTTELRERVRTLLKRYPGWNLVLIERKRNRSANRLANRPFRQAQESSQAMDRR
jgi:ribonuclease HI